MKHLKPGLVRGLGTYVGLRVNTPDWITTHSNRLHVLLLDGLGVTAELSLDPLEDVQDRLGRRDDVERRWTRAALLEVADPQLRPGKLPLDVGAFLKENLALLQCFKQTQKTQSYRNQLVRVIHHRNQQVQQHHDVDHRVRAEHQHAPEARENFDPVQLEVLQVDQSEHGPEQGLDRFEEAEIRVYYSIRKI